MVAGEDFYEYRTGTRIERVPEFQGHVKHESVLGTHVAKERTTVPYILLVFSVSLQQRKWKLDKSRGGQSL